MWPVRMACGEDVHTRCRVVDNCHAAVEKPVDTEEKRRIEQAFCYQISHFAESVRQPFSGSVRAVGSHTQEVVELSMRKDRP